MSEHTPGPWTVQNDDVPHHRDGVWIASPGAYEVATVQTEPTHGDWRANARLIAEVPAMRSELEKSADTFRDFAMANRAIYRHAMADAAQIAETSIRARHDCACPQFQEAKP